MTASFGGAARLVLAGLLALIWAVAAHLGSSGRGDPDVNAILALAPILGSLMALAIRGPGRIWAFLALLAAAAALVMTWQAVRANVAFLYFLQNFGVNIALAVLFGRTLSGPGEPLVTHLARSIEGPHLSARKLRYTRQVTQAWTVFFLANAALSAVLFATVSAAAWSIYANLLGGPLVLAMFIAEHLWRRRVLPPAERPSLATVIRAWRQHRSTPAA
ncbi:MAG: hypothetical protein JNJ44_05415 [Zoogloeaceae bacterium]|nr:hypothetical protein [Zoogloeaceae bacterium]